MRFCQILEGVTVKPVPFQVPQSIASDASWRPDISQAVEETTIPTGNAKGVSVIPTPYALGPPLAAFPQQPQFNLNNFPALTRVELSGLRHPAWSALDFSRLLLKELKMREMHQSPNMRITLPASLRRLKLSQVSQAAPVQHLMESLWTDVIARLDPGVQFEHLCLDDVVLPLLRSPHGYMGNKIESLSIARVYLVGHELLRSIEDPNLRNQRSLNGRRAYWAR